MSFLIIVGILLSELHIVLGSDVFLTTLFYTIH